MFSGMLSSRGKYLTTVRWLNTQGTNSQSTFLSTERLSPPIMACGYGKKYLFDNTGKATQGLIRRMAWKFIASATEGPLLASAAPSRNGIPTNDMTESKIES